jgi:hypothetical protein
MEFVCHILHVTTRIRDLSRRTLTLGMTRSLCEKIYSRLSLFEFMYHIHLFVELSIADGWDLESRCKPAGSSLIANGNILCEPFLKGTCQK